VFATMLMKREEKGVGRAGGADIAFYVGDR
jgi:hypothetical protein